MLNTYKHLHSLTFACCLLNKKQQEPTLIVINTVPSVSYCSTVMLYVVFNCLCIVCFSKCASQFVTERIWICDQSRYRQSICRRADSQHSNWTLSYTVQRAAFANLPSAITNISIIDFSPVVLSFIISFVMNRTDNLPADGGLFFHPATYAGLILPHATFKICFFESVITTDVKWLQQTALSLILFSTL